MLVWRYFRSSVMITRWHYYIDAVLITRWRYCRNAVVITRWQYRISAAMLTRWHYCISVDMVTGWVYWIVNVSNCKELWIARRKHQHLQNRRERPLIRKMGGSTTEREETGGQKERESGRELGCSALRKRRIKT